MEESIFEIMEQNRTVDKVLVALAILGPFLVALLLYVFRNRRFVTDNRHHWVLVFLTGPTLLILWKIYNRVVDHYGIESIFGLFVNAVIFLLAGIVLVVLNIVLSRHLPGPPESVEAEAPAPGSAAPPVP